MADLKEHKITISHDPEGRVPDGTVLPIKTNDAFMGDEEYLHKVVENELNLKKNAKQTGKPEDAGFLPTLGKDIKDLVVHGPTKLMDWATDNPVGDTIGSAKEQLDKSVGALTIHNYSYESRHGVALDPPVIAEW